MADEAVLSKIDGLTAREHADRAVFHASMAMVSTSGDTEQQIAMGHVLAATVAMNSDDGNDLVCRGIVQTALALVHGHSEEGDAAANAEMALDSAREALRLFLRAGDDRRALSARTNLATALLQRSAGIEEVNVVEAIQHYEQVLPRMSPGTPDWIDAAGNLATAYQRRKSGGKADNLARSISLIEQALAFTSFDEDAERWIDLKNNLGMLIVSLGDDRQSLTQARQHLEEALAVADRASFPITWADLHSNLSLVLWTLMDRPTPRQAEEAIDHLRRTLEVYSPQAFPLPHLETQRAIGQKLLKVGRFEEAHAAFDAAIAVGRIVFADAFTPDGDRLALKGAGSLYFRDCYCLLRMGRLDDAFARLEEGRARGLHEALFLIEMSRREGSEGAEIARLRAEVRDLQNELAKLGGDDASRRISIIASLERARAQITSAVESLAPGHFGPPSSAAEILALVPPGKWLFAPIITENGGAAFVLPPSTRTIREDNIVQLDSLTLGRLAELLNGEDGWLKTYWKRDEDQTSWMRAIVDHRATLWELVVGPMWTRATALGLASEHEILILSPGLLGMLPLHAAADPSGNGPAALLDSNVITYAPSVVSAGQISKKYGLRAGSTGITAVINPSGNLPLAEVEGEFVTGYFPADRRIIFPGAEATASHVLASARTAHCLHFACHGQFEPVQGTKSFLLLFDERLTVERILTELDLQRTRLVVLSACETGRFDFRSAPDEQLGLTWSFLEAGASCVVSTLWAVNDVATSLLMHRFYHELFDNHLVTPARALTAAQRWLKSASNSRIAAVFDEYLDNAGIRVADQLDQQFSRFALAADPAEVPFEHPYYWAAFTVNGG